MSTSSPPEVLLVDDNPADLELTAEFLSRSRASSHIHGVNSGNQALTYLLNSRPDLIVLDLNLPCKSGRAVLSEIRQNPNLKQTPVVIFSTSQAPSDILNCYDLGANSYVCKPGTLFDFISTVTTMGDFWFCCAARSSGNGSEPLKEKA